MRTTSKTISKWFGIYKLNILCASNETKMGLTKTYKQCVVDESKNDTTFGKEKYVICHSYKRIVYTQQFSVPFANSYHDGRRRREERKNYTLKKLHV